MLERHIESDKMKSTLGGVDELEEDSVRPTTREEKNERKISFMNVEMFELRSIPRQEPDLSKLDPYQLFNFETAGNLPKESPGFRDDIPPADSALENSQ